MRLTAVSTLLLLGAALEPFSVFALSCPEECTPSSCLKSPTKCAYGKIKDACNCCDFCGNGPGDQCGGEFNILGMCGKGLECISNSANEPTTFPEGLCVWKKKTYAPYQQHQPQQQPGKSQPSKLQMQLPPGLRFVPQRPSNRVVWRKHSANQQQQGGNKVARALN